MVLSFQVLVRFFPFPDFVVAVLRVAVAFADSASDSVALVAEPDQVVRSLVHLVLVLHESSEDHLVKYVLGVWIRL